MKILILVPNLNLPGGVTNYFNTLNLSNNKNIDYFQINKEKSTLKFYHLILTYFNFFYIVNDYDIVHVNPSLGSTASWRDLIFVIISKFKNKKTIVFFRGWNEKYEMKIKASKVLSKLFRLYNKSDSFIVLGKYFKKKLIDMGISSKKNFFIETTIADDKYLNHFNIDERCNNWNFNKKITFLFISRIVKNKGVYLALQIFLKIQKKYSDIDFELLIAGDGNILNDIKKYVDDKKIKNIVFTGYVENKEKYELFIHSDIMLFPTKYGEGLPNCLLEGMLYGLPIISREISAIPEWVINNQNGFLTLSTNPDDFILFISKLINDKRLYENISKSNYNKAVKLFIPKQVESRLKKIYNNL
tara:strand:- start:224 stop:1297 length:1074 start_codon:yes stop_codon:yes gene_type:complete